MVNTNINQRTVALSITIRKAILRFINVSIEAFLTGMIS